MILERILPLMTMTVYVKNLFFSTFGADSDPVTDISEQHAADSDADHLVEQCFRPQIHSASSLLFGVLSPAFLQGLMKLLFV